MLLSQSQSTGSSNWKRSLCTIPWILNGLTIRPSNCAYGVLLCRFAFSHIFYASSVYPSSLIKFTVYRRRSTLGDLVAGDKYLGEVEVPLVEFIDERE